MGREGFDWGWDHTFDNPRLIELCAKLLRPGGSLLYWTDWKLLGTLTSVAVACGLEEKDPLVLEKPSPQPRNIKRRYVSDKEFGFWCVKPKAKWTFTPAEKGYRRTLFRYDTPRGKRRVHPTQKPLQLFTDLIAIHSNPGDLVLDPCMGSGTTAVAAKNLGRRFVGCEIDLDHYSSATQALSR